MKKLKKPRQHKHVEMMRQIQEVSEPFVEDDDIDLYDQEEEDVGYDFNGDSPERLDEDNERIPYLEALKHDFQQ